MGKSAVLPAPTPQKDAATYLTRAAESDGARRFIWTSSTGLDATRPQPLVVIAKRFLRYLYADLAQAERIIMESSADWTIARSVGLTNKPGTGRIRISYGARQTPSGPYFFSRADLALALVKLVSDPRAPRTLVSINRERGAKRAHSTQAAQGSISMEPDAKARGARNGAPNAGHLLEPPAVL